MIGYYAIAGIVFLISSFVSSKLKSKFKEYSQMSLQNGMSGAEIAEKMLADNGIRDVKVISVAGMLTDHYNPSNKTVNLSEGVFNQRNAAAAAVAAHEVGHAVQHNEAYQWLQMRSKIVPMVGIASKFSNIVIMDSNSSIYSLIIFSFVPFLFISSCMVCTLFIRQLTCDEMLPFTAIICGPIPLPQILTNSPLL